MGIVLDAGAEDMRRQGENFEIVCDPASFNKVQEALTANKIIPINSEITQLAKVPVDVDAEMGRKVLRLHEALDDHDDVQHVCFNANIPDEVLAEG